MTATPAVAQPASSVLPEDMERWNDMISVTKPGDGYMFDTEFAKTCVHRTILYLRTDGSLEFYRAAHTSLADLAAGFGSDWCRAVHVLRPMDDRDGHDFHYNDVRLAFEENPWIQHRWYKDNFLRWAEHLPRQSETVKGAVAYYQNRDKRRRNILTPIKPGRFLKKFFGDILSEAEIHELGLEWSNHVLTRALKVTQDADEIEVIYKARKLGSCMHFGDDDYSGSQHPTRVYAGPDLGIAYIGSTDEPDGRCLVWPDRKIYYPKYYGDESRLVAALKAEGFVPGYAAEFKGARIQRIFDAHRSRYVVPYVDCADWAEDDSEYLILGQGRIPLGNTNGIASRRYEYHCYDCSTGLDADDANWVDGREVHVCESCLDNYYFYCEGSSEYHHNNNLASTDTADEGSYSQSFVENNPNWFQCEGDRVWYLRSEVTPVVDANHDTYHPTYAEANGYYCSYREEWHVDNGSGEVKLSNGTSVNMDNFANDEAFQEYLADNELTLLTPLPAQEAA